MNASANVSPTDPAHAARSRRGSVSAYARSRASPASVAGPSAAPTISASIKS
jgi:hypothetical protein